MRATAHPQRSNRVWPATGRGRLAGVAALGALGLLAFPLGAVASRSTLKLPAERTSPTGNYFTLEAYAPPTASHRIADFEMKVCTSAHTPADTEIDPALFTLSTSGGSIPESTAAARSPAIVLKPLKPRQCTEGWLGFTVPAGRAVSRLIYDYNGRISWAVG